jgi:hypothetical protein
MKAVALYLCVSTVDQHPETQLQSETTDQAVSKDVDCEQIRPDRICKHLGIH